MAVKTENGVTTITPTGWKWLTMAVLSFFVPLIGMFIALYCLAMASGKFSRLVLTPDTLTAYSWGTTDSHKWASIDSFHDREIRIRQIPVGKKNAFYYRKDDTTLRLQTGRDRSARQSVPSIGMSSDDLMDMFEAYQRGHIPADNLQDAPRNAKPKHAPDLDDALIGQVAGAALKTAVKARKKKAIPNPNTPLVEEGFKFFGRRPS